MMKDIRLLMIGFGNVGRAFARLLMQKQVTLENSYGIRAKVTGIKTARHGACINADGIDLNEALHLVENKQDLGILSTQSFNGDTLNFIKTCPADVLIETTPVNPQAGTPAIDHLRTGFEYGMHGITANKGPVVYAYRKLNELAQSKGLKFRFESAVMDGAPIFSLHRHTLAGTEIEGFVGILNSCTNLLIEAMEDGTSLEDAVRHAQEIGIAESDPSNDIDGWDAAIKVAALSTVLMNHPITPLDVDRTGIRDISSQMIADAKLQGKRWKLVCRGGWENDKFIAQVKPEMVGADSPLFSVAGTSSFVSFSLDVLPGLGILESDPSPKTTAFGLLADLIDIYKGA